MNYAVFVCVCICSINWMFINAFFSRDHVVIFTFPVPSFSSSVCFSFSLSHSPNQCLSPSFLKQHLLLFSVHLFCFSMSPSFYIFVSTFLSLSLSHPSIFFSSCHSTLSLLHFFFRSLSFTLTHPALSSSLRLCICRLIDGFLALNKDQLAPYLDRIDAKYVDKELWNFFSYT